MLAGTSADINGAFNVAVPVPGKARDSADFFDGKVTGNQVSFYAKNSMSTFRFDGVVNGEALNLTMTVTDTRYAVEGMRQ